MEELQPQDIEELVQELKGEYGAGEPLSSEVEQLLRDLQSQSPMELKEKAVKRLAELSRSEPQIIKALTAASIWDPSPQFRRLAAASLLAPAHQAVLQQHPELLPRHVKNLLRDIKEGGAGEATPERAEDLLHDLQQGPSVPPGTRAAQQLGQVDESSSEIVQAQVAAWDKNAVFAIRETLTSPIRPGHFRVETQGSTLCLSWKDGALHRVLSAGLTLLLLLAFGYSLFTGIFSESDMCALMPALLMSGYWLLVAFVNSTRITASREEWVVQRGPFPFPNRRFYSFGKIRIDPAAYRDIRAVPVKEKRRLGHGSGGSSDIGTAIAEVLVGALIEQFMEPRITYTLYARAKDGTGKLLLARLEGQEAAYLRHTLQDLLDAGGGPPAHE